MKIAIPVFEGFTALDAVGPYEVLSRLPGWDVDFVAERTGPVATDTGRMRLDAMIQLADMPDPDVIVVPGGSGTRRLAEFGGPLVDWIRSVHATTRFTTSVCTGSLLLGAAGVLDGLDATTHWAVLDSLRLFGATPVSRRVVAQGKVITAAGVSAGIDMALRLAAELAGEATAKAIQLSIEYDPEPPFDAGSPANADPALLELIRRETPPVRAPLGSNPAGARHGRSRSNG